MKVSYVFALLLLISLSMIVSGCGPKPAKADPGEPAVQASEEGSPITSVEDASVSEETLFPSMVEFTLETQIRDGRMVYIGVGGEIDGLVNPDLVVKAGSEVKATLINGDGISHDLYFDNSKAKTSLVSTKGKLVEVRFTVDESQVGTSFYYCTQPGHRKAGQEGQLVVQP